MGPFCVVRKTLLPSDLNVKELRSFVPISCELRKPPVARALLPEIASTKARFHGMVSGMATTKITITLQDDQVNAIRGFVAAGKASSVSGFVQHAVSIALFDAAGWRTMLDDALRQTGGPLTKQERAWADALLDPQESKPGHGKSSPGKGRTRRHKAA
jgi:Arc/MetJ-type ribon-helix-helix transcriptional regulator